MTTTETLPTDVTAKVDAYLAAWNETDAAARADLAATALGGDLWYRDPMLEADGRDAFVASVGAVQQQFPDHVMRRTTDIDAHHDLVRFGWALTAPDGHVLLAGLDVAKFDADGRLHRIIGFTPPTLDDAAA